MRCRECGSEDLQIVRDTDVKTTGKNYSGGQGCLGFLMFGPLGLLCGNCGQGQKTQVQQKTYWVCSKCGHKFRDPEEWRTEVKQLRTSSIGVIVLGVLCFLYWLIDGEVVPGVMSLVVLGLCGFMELRRADKNMAEIDRLDAFLNEQQ